MKKEDFLELMELNKEADRAGDFLYETLSSKKVELEYNFFTTNAMLSKILTMEYNEEVCDIVNAYLYENRVFSDVEYSKEKPFLWDGATKEPIVWDIDTLYNYIESLNK